MDNSLETKAEISSAASGAEFPAAVRKGEKSGADTLAVVEAILFATDTPLPLAKIAQTAELPARVIRGAIEQLNARYEQMGCAFQIENIAGGFQMLTRPVYHEVLSRLFRARGENRLSQAAMETLAIVAYRQPILRADVESIRGVACGELLRGLMDKQLVKIVGRAEVIGRPMLYGTTKRFLELFGLAGLDDLPKAEELRSGAVEGLKKSPAAAPEAENLTVSEAPASPQDAPPSPPSTEA